MPPVTTVPYPTAELVLQTARAMCNDAAQSIAGNILADSQPFVFPMLEERYEYLQERLIEAGVNTYSKYGVITGLTPVGTTDPTAQVRLSYTGYYDGAAAHGSPTLPADLLEPLEVWERQTATQNFWQPVAQASDSIGARSQTSRFRIWDWESDILYLQGATLSNDLKLKYISFAPVLTGPTAQVLIARSVPALAALMAEAAAKSRGGTEAATMFHAQAEEFIKMIINRTARKEQYASFNRIPFRRRRGRR